jgi:hypothetical protein
MGGSASKATGSVRDPFRIDTATDRDLDTLTFVTTRVLNTPDIYDIYNLKNAGTCGEYAVFVKEVIEKRLLNQMVVKVKDKDGRESLKEIYYQNPRKLMPPEDQKQICAEVARAAIQAVTTVVACLASIQVAFSPRVVPQQRGGDIPQLKPWFLNNGVVSLPPGGEIGARKPVKLNGTAAQTAGAIEFYLVLEETRGDITTGWVVARDQTADPAKRLPQTEGLRINFLADPIEVSPTSSVVAVRILDHAGRPWMAGILVKIPSLGNKTYFKSFAKGDENYREFTNVIEDILRKSLGQPFSFGLNETREQLTEANKLFEQIRDTKGARLPLLQSNISTTFFTRAGIQVQATVAPAPAPGTSTSLRRAWSLWFPRLWISTGTSTTSTTSATPATNTSPAPGRSIVSHTGSWCRSTTASHHRYSTTLCSINSEDLRTVQRIP